MEQTLEEQMSALERYERGLVLKQLQAFSPAIAEFQQAATDPEYAGKAHTQVGLCFRCTGRYIEAVEAFRQALKSPTLSSEERINILYLLGRALELLNRYEETLVIYRAISIEEPGFLDVAQRIEHVRAHRSGPIRRRQQADQSWVGDMLKSGQELSVHILHQLGPALESLGRHAQTLVTAAAQQIERLSSRRSGPVRQGQPADQSWIGVLIKSWQELLKIK